LPIVIGSLPENLSPVLPQTLLIRDVSIIRTLENEPAIKGHDGAEIVLFLPGQRGNQNFIFFVHAHESPVKAPLIELQRAI
jgi:hypothetical protein